MTNMETFAESGYAYVCHAPELGGHILRDTSTDTYELWFANKHHANYGLIYKNTHLEFARGVSATEAAGL